MNQKRTMSILTAVGLLIALFAGCGQANRQEETATPQSESSQEERQAESAPEAAPEQVAEEESERPEVRVAALIGPTGMGMVGLMDAAERAETACDYRFTLAASPDEVAPKVISGELDIAAVPANLASVLYNRTNGGVTVLAVNTLGVLYIVTTGEEIASLEDLSGRTIYATGQGATPEYTLNYLLAQNGVDAQVEFKSEHAELAALLLAGEADIAMLPEPFVTNVTTRDDGIRVALDLTEQWEKTVDGAALPTGSIVVRNEFLEQHPQAVASFLEEYRASTEFVNEELEAAAELIGRYEIASAEIARQAIPRCNIVFLSGDAMKTALETYYGILLQADPQSVGGALPDEDFYYQG